jgi:hypothetical protein
MNLKELIKRAMVGIWENSLPDGEWENALHIPRAIRRLICWKPAE